MSEIANPSRYRLDPQLEENKKMGVKRISNIPFARQAIRT